MDVGPLLRQARSATQPRLDLVPDPGAVRSLAMLAGSFDPITVGHEALAREAATRVERVALVFSVRALPKEGPGPPPLLPEETRVESLARFCAARPGHVLGLASHGLLSEQVDAAAARYPDAELWLVMGSDKVLQVLDPKWYTDRDASLRALFAKSGVLYADRAGQEGEVQRLLDTPENRRWRGHFERIAVPPSVVAVSSRLVRELLARGRPVDRLVPREALEAIPPEGAG